MKRNKILFLLCLFFMCLCFCTFVSASTTYTLSDGFTFTTTDSFDNYLEGRYTKDLLILRNSSNIGVVAYNSNNNELVINKPDNRLLSRIPGGTDWSIGFDYYTLTLNDLNELDNYVLKYPNIKNLSFSLINLPYYTNKNIYYYTDTDRTLYDEIVFEKKRRNSS